MNKKIFIASMALAVGCNANMWAQSNELFPNENKTEFTLDAMPAYDIELAVEYYTDLSEAEDVDYSSIQGTTADLWVNRQLAPGVYNTLALPFDMSIDDFKAKVGDMGAKVMTPVASALDGKTLTLTFEDASSIEAGKPYLVEFSGVGNVVLGAFDGVSIPASVAPQTQTCGDYVSFVPTLGKITANEPNTFDVLLVGDGNELVNPDAASYDVNGFQAFFLIINETDEPLANRVVFNIDGVDVLVYEAEDAPTRVTATQADVSDNDWYTVSGVKLKAKPSHRGVFINGRKKIVR